MAPPNGESEAASWVVAEPCTMPVGTEVHTTAMESTLYLEEVTPQLAGPSGTHPEILTCGYRSQGGSHCIISHRKKLAQDE